MKKISILLCLIIILAFSGCLNFAFNESTKEEIISVTEDQKAKAKELYQLAESVSEIEVYGADHPYYLSQIKLYKSNNTDYFGFCYYDKTRSSALKENNGGVTTILCVEHTYKDQNGWITRCDGELSSNFASTASASWNSLDSYEEQLQQLYKIAQYL